jgi:hypothetical protein
VIAPEATPEEVAAITAAISTVLEEQRAVAAAGCAVDSERLDAWVRASRLTARRTGLKRGPWRLSGRIGRRSRA